MNIQYLSSDLEKQAMYQLRNQVFVVEQQVDPAIEIDAYDQQHPDIYYLGAFINQQLVGTIRIRQTENAWILQRLAVKKELRKQRLGSKLIDFCIVAAKNKNIKEIRLHSQIQVLDFYLKLGFEAQGEIFEEAKILHQEVIYSL